ncbi:phage tail protein [Litoribrevibacter euphylliae]|uniref:Phage tail protein n=1 Tax=Litoribrevibacter euphylliae TaxID=1834034 RepID=A0ABV7HJE9_9GAMM
MSADPYLGEIELYGGNFAPRNTMLCNGQIQAIVENEALFSLLGTIYGGNGRVDFGLPDLRCRTPVGWGNGPGLPTLVQGQKFGTMTHQLGIREMPSHTHIASAGKDGQTVTATTKVNAAMGEGDTNSPEGAYWAVGSIPVGLTNTPVSKGYSTKSSTKMASDAIEVAVPFNSLPAPTIEYAGGGLSFGICQPSLTLTFTICFQGIYPSRN